MARKTIAELEKQIAQLQTEKAVSENSLQKAQTELKLRDDSIAHLQAWKRRAGYLFKILEKMAENLEDSCDDAASAAEMLRERYEMLD